MAFVAKIKEEVDRYAQTELGDKDWFRRYFSFVNRPALAARLADEYYGTRYTYKLFEGLQVQDALLRTQIRIQVLSYASLYEAVLHHLLFERMAAHPTVIKLLERPKYVNVDIPQAKRDALSKALQHNGNTLLTMAKSIGHIEEEKVRFDQKAKAACHLGFISPALEADLVLFYEARNAIHIHAELKKDINYQIELGRNVYRRMQPFRNQVIEGMRNHALDTGLIIEGLPNRAHE